MTPVDEAVAKSIVQSVSTKYIFDAFIYFEYILRNSMVLILRTNIFKRVEIFILIKLYAALKYDLLDTQAAGVTGTGSGIGSVGSTAQFALLIAVEPAAPAVIHA